MRGPICVLAGESPLSRALISSLAREFEIAGVILERPPAAAAVRMLWRRLIRLGAPTIVGQLLFLAYDRLVIRRQSAPWIESLAAACGEPPAGLRWHRVRSINGKEAHEVIRRYRPEICVVSGTSILRKALLQSAPLFLNLHCGITPAYRGVHGAFWAIYQRDWKNVGVSVHRIDAGVDTGPIVSQAPISLDPRADSLRTLVIKQYAAGIPLMVQAVREALGGSLRTCRREDLKSSQWFGPTLAQYFRFRRILRREATAGLLSWERGNP